MVNSRTTMRWALASAGAMIFSLGANTAMAGAPTVKGCQAALEGIINKYQITVYKNLAKCADTVQKSVDKGVALTSAKEGAACNGDFVKSEGAETKTQAKCLGLFPGKCNAATLHLLGHLVGGDNAPAVPGLGDFVCNALIDRAEALAIQAFAANNPLGLGQIATVAALGGPNTELIEFAATEPEEATHICTLSGAATASLTTKPPILFGTLTFPVAGKVAININPDEDNPAYMALSGGVAKGVSPVFLPFGTVCVSTLGAEGACDCSAAAPNWNKSITLCRDSDTTAGGGGDTCPNVGTISLDNSAGTTANGPLWATYGPAVTGTGDCTGNLTTQFKIVTAGQVGADLTACTNDDTATPLPAAPIPFSTGVSSATILDTNNVAGQTATASATGAPAPSCVALQTSNLSGVTFGGAVPTMDGTQTGDAIIKVSLSCS